MRITPTVFIALLFNIFFVGIVNVLLVYDLMYWITVLSGMSLSIAYFSLTIMHMRKKTNNEKFLQTIKDVFKTENVFLVYFINISTMVSVAIGLYFIVGLLYAPIIFFIAALINVLKYSTIKSVANTEVK